MLPRCAGPVRDCVYVATSPLLNAVKIGRWSGSPKALRSRYLTVLGDELTIQMYPCLQAGAGAEAEVHARLQPFRYGKRQLFSKDHLELYKRVCLEVSQTGQGHAATPQALP